MIVSYYPKKGNHLLIITAAHKDTDVCIKDVKKKIDFCNSQCCWLDIVKVMLKDYNFEPINNSWTFVTFTFTLGLAVDNAKTIMKYISSQNKNQSRHKFLKNLSFQLCLPHIKKSKEISSLQKTQKTKSILLWIMWK